MRGIRLHWVVEVRKDQRELGLLGNVAAGLKINLDQLRFAIDDGQRGLDEANEVLTVGGEGLWLCVLIKVPERLRVAFVI